LLSRQQQPHSRGDDRERITRARQAAEALFTPKRPLSEPSIPESLTSADHSVRKPRVLRILPASPVRREEVTAPVRSEPPRTREIPRSEFARIRAWMKYGMTVAQVAGVYGVAVGAIERILRQG
jgi:hypothetical protein